MNYFNEEKKKREIDSVIERYISEHNWIDNNPKKWIKCIYSFGMSDS